MWWDAAASIQVEIEDLDGVARHGMGEGGGGVVDGGGNRDDTGGIGDGVCGLGSWRVEGGDGGFRLYMRCSGELDFDRLRA